MYEKKKKEREGDRRERALYVWICQKMVAACDRCQAWTFWLKYLSLKVMLDRSTHLHPSHSTKEMVRKIQGRIKKRKRRRFEVEEEEKEEEDFLKYFASKAPSQLLPKDAIFEETFTQNGFFEQHPP